MAFLVGVQWILLCLGLLRPSHILYMRSCTLSRWRSFALSQKHRLREERSLSFPSPLFWKESVITCVSPNTKDENKYCRHLLLIFLKTLSLEMLQLCRVYFEEFHILSTFHSISHPNPRIPVMIDDESTRGYTICRKLSRRARLNYDEETLE